MREFITSNGLDLGYKVLTHHCHSVKSGTRMDIYSLNKIICAYTKRGELGLAQKLFDESPHKDRASWNSMISGYISSGYFNNAWDLLDDMRKSHLMLDCYTFSSILKGISCGEHLDLGLQVHAAMVKMGCEASVFSASALLDMYAKCRRIYDASMVFDRMHERNSVSWNSMIAAYAELADRERVFYLLQQMELEGMMLDDGTFSPLLTLLDDTVFYDTTRQIHTKIIKHALEYETTVCNAMISSYSDCGSMEDSKKVFNLVEERDLVTWNSMLATYLAHNQSNLALKLFIEMHHLRVEPDIYSYTSIISSCFEETHSNQGKHLHGLVMKRGLNKSTPILNALLSMYLKTDKLSVGDAMSVFSSIDFKDSVSWNTVLTEFSQKGLSEYALKVFGSMQAIGVALDRYSLSAALVTCSDFAALGLGQQVHGLVIKTGLVFNVFVVSALIFMYSKCGVLECARKSFDYAPKNSSVTWNSIIFGYAHHGYGKDALNLFKMMRERKVRLDHITFVAVLTACSHNGFIDEGCKFLESMESEYGIHLQVEHYACGIDLYGRAGRIEDVKALIRRMPFEPNAMVLTTLMGACRTCGDVELAREIASSLLELQPEEHSTYVILSNLYGHLRRWDDKAAVARLMRERGVKKVPGWSWIEVKNEVHAFNAEDRSHPQCKELYSRLEDLMEEIRKMDDIIVEDDFFFF